MSLGKNGKSSFVGEEKLSGHNKSLDGFGEPSSDLLIGRQVGSDLKYQT